MFIWIWGDGWCNRFIQLPFAVQFVSLLRAQRASSHAHFWYGIVFAALILIENVIDAPRTSHSIALLECIQAIMAALKETGHFFHYGVIHLTARFNLLRREKPWKKINEFCLFIKLADANILNNFLFFFLTSYLKLFTIIQREIWLFRDTNLLKKSIYCCCWHYYCYLVFWKFDVHWNTFRLGHKSYTYGMDH